MPRSTHNGPLPEAVFAYGVSKDEVIIGIDEVGRGAWAGPVVAAAVAMPAHLMIDGVNDSKRLSHKRRELLDRHIKAQAHGVGIGWVSPRETDEYGLSWAIVESGRRALMELVNHTQSRVFIDGSWNYPAEWRQSDAIIKGDGLIVPIAAASIVAKVARDRFLKQLDIRTPGYGFGDHVGYGTAAHRQALRELGVSNEHRRSYKPIKELPNVDN